MIIVRITGGLGNQLFQYAAGRRLAAIHRTDLKLDITEVVEKAYRPYLLDRFAIHASVATAAEISSQIGLLRFVPEMLEPYAASWMPWLAPRVIREKTFMFDPSFLSAGDDRYLIGYWQSEKYFDDIEERLRADIVVKVPLSERSRSAAKKISSGDSVALSMRRGDYVTDPRIHAKHGVLDIAYYDRAIAYLAKQINHPVFYIFSDDIQWAKQHLHLEYQVTFMDFNYPDRTEEDIALMSACRYHILANSTFSWWGAWLVPDPKIVIAPKQWFGDKTIPTKGLFPEEWIVM